MTQAGIAREFVGVYPVNRRGEVLLQLRDDRPELDGPGSWSTLGGRMEPAETPEQASHRELLEECGRDAEQLVPFQVVERFREDKGFRYRFHTFGAAVDWSLDDLILGEGQGLAWWPVAALPELRLNPLIIDNMLAFAAGPLPALLAEAAPPTSGGAPAPLPEGFARDMGIKPGALIAVHGATAAFAGALRRLLPAGARLSASPGAGEHPAVTLWWPRGPVDPGRFLALAAPLAPGDSLWVMTAGPAALAPLWSIAAALRLAYVASMPFPAGEEGARFLRRPGRTRELE